MEQIGLKSPSTVHENSLASEVNQMSNNFPKSCRLKNGLVNGVVEDKCNSTKNHTKVTLIMNQDSRKPISDISKEKPCLPSNQNCLESAALPQQDVETNSSIEINQNDSHCNSSSSNDRVSHTKQDRINSGNSTAVSGLALNVNSDCDLPQEANPTEVAVLKDTMDTLDFQDQVVGGIEKLTIDKPDDSTSICGTTSALVKLEPTQEDSCEITYVQYESELQMPLIMKIIQKDLSEPYSIYTYRYFIHNWPKLCFLAMCDEKCVGAIVCKLDYHRKSTKRGYIAMLAVDQHYRKKKIGSTLVRRAIKEMIIGNADEVVLETEVTNKPALRLYELLGFVRDKRLFRYYLNGVDALRLKLWLR